MKTFVAHFLATLLWMNLATTAQSHFQKYDAIQENHVRQTRSSDTREMKCSDDEYLYKGDSLTLVSNGYPDNYANLEDCSTSIKTSQRSALMVIFRHFQVDRSDNVTFNPDYQFTRFCVRSGPVVYSGTYLPGYFVVFRTETLGIRLQSDQSLVASGFHFDIVSTRALICGEIYNEILTGGTSVLVESPGYPKSYGPNITCSTTIGALPGLGIRIQVIDFDLDCGCCDFFTVNEDVKYNCNRSSVPRVMYLNENSVTLGLQTDGAAERSGFQILVSAGNYGSLPDRREAAICEGVYVLGVEEELVMTSPNYTETDRVPRDCSTVIYSADGFQMYYELLDIEAVCSDGDIRVNDVNLSCEDNYVGRSKVASDTLSILFSGFKHFQGEGFIIRVWQEVVETSSLFCEDNYFRLAPGEEMIVTSPNYPDNYGPNLECFTTVFVDYGTTVYYKLITLDKECCCDHFYMNAKSVSCLSAMSTIGKTQSAKNFFQLAFYSHNYVSHGGYSVLVWADGGTQTCDDEFVQMPFQAMVITSPNYPSNYNSDQECVTRVTALGNATISVKILDFKVQCCCDILTINGVRQRCKDHYSEKTDLSSDQLVVVFSTNHFVEKRGYKIHVFAESHQEQYSEEPYDFNACADDAGPEN
ncbi:cubilin-like isoform X2 [Ptychodera flava]|uniref:cubilin-like isoform X2 n=1 Tax=Ptychodera flava TaxID=63121 RepID=UPI00396A9D8A